MIQSNGSSIEGSGGNADLSDKLDIVGDFFCFLGDFGEVGRGRRLFGECFLGCFGGDPPIPGKTSSFGLAIGLSTAACVCRVEPGIIVCLEYFLFLSQGKIVGDDFVGASTDLFIIGFAVVFFVFETPTFDGCLLLLVLKDDFVVNFGDDSSAIGSERSGCIVLLLLGVAFEGFKPVTFINGAVSDLGGVGSLLVSFALGPVLIVSCCVLITGIEEDDTFPVVAPFPALTRPFFFPGLGGLGVDLCFLCFLVLNRFAPKLVVSCLMTSIDGLSGVAAEAD
mmetsp:Transcript_13652/g.15070  ORF Transcript_13652/g.15070 Transcript_13652/m.15070 type:complete len:280 (-) Transcript_13652:365-1204(-)